VHRVGLSIGDLVNVLLWVCVYGGVGITSVFVQDLRCAEGANVGRLGWIQILDGMGYVHCTQYQY